MKYREDYKESEMIIKVLDNGCKIKVCPQCENHKQRNVRGDCKNLYIKNDGNIAQCQCYSKEHA